MTHEHSWHMRGALHSGDRVSATVDPRHIGRVEAVLNGTAVVTWDNGFVSHLPVKELTVVERVAAERVAAAPIKTVLPSPKRKAGLP